MDAHLLCCADKGRKQILIIEFNRYGTEVAREVDLYSVWRLFNLTFWHAI